MSGCRVGRVSRFRCLEHERPPPSVCPVPLSLCCLPSLLLSAPCSAFVGPFLPACCPSSNNICTALLCCTDSTARSWLCTPQAFWCCVTRLQSRARAVAGDAVTASNHLQGRGDCSSDEQCACCHHTSAWPNVQRSAVTERWLRQAQMCWEKGCHITPRERAALRKQPAVARLQMRLQRRHEPGSG